MAEVRTNSTRKMVSYRKFNPVVGDWPAGQLHELCGKALQTKGESGLTLQDDWLSRRFPARNSADHFLFTYALAYANSSLFGMLCLYSPNEYLAMIREEAEQEAEDKHLPLSEVMKKVEVAEREPPKGEHYLKGNAYFLVRGNHVFIVQHTAVRAEALEQYVYDLLSSTKTITAHNKFALDATLELSADSKELGEITAVEIGGVMAAPPPVPVAKDVEEHKELARARTEKPTGRKILDLMFGAVKAEEIMNEVPPEADLEVDVRFGYKARGRKFNRAALSQIASAARHLPEGQVRAVGRDGKAKGDDLRLQTEMPFRRLRPNGALLDTDHAREQLLKVYARFVEDDKIEP